MADHHRPVLLRCPPVHRERPRIRNERSDVPAGRVPGGGVDRALSWATVPNRPPTTPAEEETRVLVTLVTVGFAA